MSLILDGDGGCSAKKESQFFRAVLRMLKRRRVGEHVSFQIQLPDLVGDWRPEVEEEYEQVLGHRKINISRGLETWACFGL
ncbi:hypothetical protein P691DRAFT_812640 [Macrolepiota fuliginosa MF-IS2]|uniref:Uncharacterized protein n=1 Tax=Macrolepiota fuliginosa MF-IS2 TaxID=1400762 RepID=A0A9P5WYN1_9AGAR|nr:hypothetical protein P691DRAFT_812640 [Macrolepiota fuliginosa MF-IS2]